MQLISSGTIAYQKLLNIGFPSQLAICELYEMFGEHFKHFQYNNVCKKKFCETLLLSNGLKKNEFRFGNTKIFFRAGKLDVVERKFRDDVNIIINRYEKHLLLRSKLRVSFIVARFLSIFKKVATKLEISESFDVPLKKVKLCKQSQQLMERITSHKPAKKLNNEERPTKVVRFDRTDHFPEYDDKKFSTRCKFQENEMNSCRYKTKVFCTKCKIHLCFAPTRNCFKNYHTNGNS